MKNNALATVLVSSLVLLLAHIGRADTQLYFTGSPQSYVAPAGTAYMFSPRSGYVFDENSGTGFMSFTIHTPDWSEVWGIEFATPDGTDFRLYADIGSYDSAQRSPFQELGHPGLSLHGDGRGYNESSGWFNVLDFARGEDGKISHTTVHFYQQGEDFHGMRDSWELGTLQYEASVAPEPGTIAIAGISALVLFLFRIFRRK